MKMKRFLPLSVVLCSALAATVPASAAKPKAFDLYSWPQEGTANFCYALLPSSKEVRLPAEIKAAKVQVCGGRDDLKLKVGQTAPADSKLNWKVDEPKGFVLPTPDIVNDFKRFSETIPYKLVFPE